MPTFRGKQGGQYDFEIACFILRCELRKKYFLIDFTLLSRKCTIYLLNLHYDLCLHDILIIHNWNICITEKSYAPIVSKEPKFPRNYINTPSMGADTMINEMCLPDTRVFIWKIMDAKKEKDSIFEFGKKFLSCICMSHIFEYSILNESYYILT